MQEIALIEQVRDLLSQYTPRRLVDEQLKQAAVLVPIYEKSGIYHILFTKRSDQVEHHKGQVSFPGGAHDEGDYDLQFTALRETYEEIGVHPQDVEVIGQLDDIVTISNFLVTPYVGRILRSPYNFVPYVKEVASILEVPLSHLLDPANLRWDSRLRPDGTEFAMPTYLFNEHVIFGATARILHHFLSLIWGPELTTTDGQR